MRILICLSSLPRHFGLFVESFNEKVLRHIPHPVDLVAHFAEEPDGTALAALLSKVENKLIKVESDPTFTWELEYDEFLIGNQGIKGNLLQWHSMISCNQLKKQQEEQLGLKYDWVIWTRPDIFFFNDLYIHFDENPDQLYVPAVDGHDGLNDRFCYGSSEVLDARMTILEYFLNVWYPNYHDNPKYLKTKGKIWARYKCWNPEMVFDQLLKDKGIEYHYLDLIIGKFRQKVNDSGYQKTYVSIPFFDSKQRVPGVKAIKKKLRKVRVHEFEDERTPLFEYSELKDVLNKLELS